MRPPAPPGTHGLRILPILSPAFCCLLSILSAGCGKKTTPDWNTPEDAPRESTTQPERNADLQPTREAPEAGAKSAATAPTDSDPRRDAGHALRFVAYNVENWLTMERSLPDRSRAQDAPKPEEEKEAVVNLLVKTKPDVIGLCEIGNEADLDDLRKRLATAGLGLPHSHHVGGTDRVRFLGLLSRFPIVATAKPLQTDFQLKGRTFGINRGILDATVRTATRDYRFVGVHLKSKREIEVADQEQMRIQEAHLLRRHVDAALRENREARIVVYGDFNDTYPSSTVRIITGPDPARRLKPVYLRDSRGESWTHHWSFHDIYSRIDFVTTAPALGREVDFKASRIIDDPLWKRASDHRPLLVVFKSP
jgi:endonuclease/exonuclease/phosphatase family metal-dependent hydrolase